VPVYRVAETALNPVQRAYQEACQAVGYARLEDINDGRGVPGIGILPKNMSEGVRATSAFAYLDAVRERLAVLADHQVDRLRWEGDRVVGAVLLGPSGLVEVAAERVVLAAGVFGTPTILQRSGIGPPDWLRALGLPRVHPLPGVGANLMDHPGTVVELAAEPATYAALGALHARGALAGSEVALLGQVDEADDQFDLHALLYGTWQPPGDPYYERYRLIMYAMRPRSRGRVRIRSLDPKAPPVIEPNYLGDPADLATLVATVRLARQIAAQPALQAVAPTVLAPDAAVQSDAALAAFVRRSLRTFNHSVGTSRMGPADDPLAVVGADGRVHGFANLYVADASLMPRIPSVATNHTTFAVAEKIADGMLGAEC
jgi:choline dehydrogenase